MKKVLILTYYWPPSGGAGVQRWLKFTKYLKKYGWEPIIYTAENGEMPVVDMSLLKDVPEELTILKTPIWEPYQLYKRFIGRKKDDKINASFLSENKKAGLSEKISIWIRGNFFIPDARKFWIKPSINYLKNYIIKNNIEYIISSGPPHSMHLIALGLKNKFTSLKWVADFRDPWTNIDFYDKLMLTKRSNNKHHSQELKVLTTADIILSIGKGMSDEFLNIYQKSGGKNLNKFKVISNGFDADDIKTSDIIKDKKFSIAHIGTLVKDRNPIVLWKVLKKLTDTRDDFRSQLEIKLVGKVDIFVKEQRPDFIINLPDSKNIIIDSKVSLVAYEKFFNDDDEIVKQKYLKEHVNAISKHITDLSSKNYQKLYEINAPDYVLLFIPIEPALFVAINDEPRLFEKALEKNIVLVTTSNLLATLRTIAYMWKQENQRKYVTEIANESGLLYDKFVGFLEDLTNLGRKIDGIKTDYSEAMNKLVDSKQKATTIIGRMERIKKLGANTTKNIPNQFLEE